MIEGVRSPFLRTLRDRIDITKVPFSSRGSRLLIYRQQEADALCVKFAERLKTLETGLEAHRHRPPYIDDLMLLDEKGAPLSFKLTTYPHALFFETSIGVFKLILVASESIMIAVPDGRTAGIRMRVDGRYDTIKILHVHTHGGWVKQECRPGEGETVHEYIIRAGESIALTITPGRPGEVTDDPPEAFSPALSRTERVWDEWFARVPAIAGTYREQYYYAWWVLANNFVSPLGNLKYEGLMPSKHQYIGVWNWDSAFHAIALRHADPGLARDQIRIMLEAQLPDGMIPDVVFDEGVVDEIDHPFKARVTKPPVLAWAALKIHEIEPDLPFLREIYPGLVRWNRWWFDERRSMLENLAAYHHPYSSGLDDSPLWDHGFPVVSPDLNTYLAIQMESLGVMADYLDLAKEAEFWRHRAHATVQRMLEVLYEENLGWFQALSGGKPIMELTPFNLLPLWTGTLPSEAEKRLIDHLIKPELFWGDFPLATVARNHASYQPSTMWRGPVWLNINYMFVEALARTAHRDLAVRLRSQTIDMVNDQDGIFEYYNADSGSAPASAAPMFGWSAALFIDLLIQQSRESVQSSI